MSSYSLINIIAIIWFLLVWGSYSYFVKYQAKKGDSLSALLDRQRLLWMQRMLDRDNRISDAILVANLERNCAFLASTSILILAGLLTSLGVVDEIEKFLHSLPFYSITEETYAWIYFKNDNL